VRDHEFRDLVERMRKAQKAFFAGRNVADLREATKLEERVDRAIRRDRDGQGALSFGEGEGTV
jgi:hypothetical protein